MRGVLAGAALLAVMLAPAAGAQDFETTEMADGVYQFRWVGHSGMFVAAGDAVVAFDPLSEFSHFGQFDEWMPLNARALYRWIAGGR